MRGLTSGIAAAITLFSTGAFAQDHDPAASQALFDQAVALTREGKFDDACPKFQESYRLDASIGALFQLANCQELKGRVASAWVMFLDVASQSRARMQAERETMARDRAAKLEPRLPRLVVNVPEGSKLSGLEIRRNGILVGSAQWGTPMPVDPGDVELSISAPGKHTLRQTVRLEEAKTSSYSVPTLADGEDAPPPAPPTPLPAAAPPPPPPPAAPPAAAEPGGEPAAGSGNKRWSIGLGALGIVGLGVGTTFALLAKSKDTDSKDQCRVNEPNACNGRGVELRNSALTQGNVATVGFAVGGAALLGAGVLWLTSSDSTPKHAARARSWHATPSLGPKLAAVCVEGQF